MPKHYRKQRGKLKKNGVPRKKPKKRKIKKGEKAFRGKDGKIHKRKK